MNKPRKGRSRKKTIAPGVEVRSEGSGANISFGVPGNRVTIGSSGRVTRTHGYRTTWDQAFDPFDPFGGIPGPNQPGGVGGQIEHPGPPPEAGWLDDLPKPAAEPANPHFEAAMDDLDTLDPTQPEDYLPDRGKLRRKAEDDVDRYDPTQEEDWN